MDLIPHDELKKEASFNFAPMIDFLFLMLSLFATLAMSRATLFDADIDLASIRDAQQGSPLHAKERPREIHLSINKEGYYQWMTEFGKYPMESAQAVKEELIRQNKAGILPQGAEVLLHIDKQAPWSPIAAVIFSIREGGFEARPVYEKIDP